ncbi:hypothetical protein AB0H83_45275 [Dactylosporangium sp. NPDC050688]
MCYLAGMRGSALVVAFGSAVVAATFGVIASIAGLAAVLFFS